MDDKLWKVSLVIEATAYVSDPGDFPPDVVESMAVGSVSLWEPADGRVKLELEQVAADDIVMVEAEAI